MIRRWRLPLPRRRLWGLTGLVVATVTTAGAVGMWLTATGRASPEATLVGVTALAVAGVGALGWHVDRRLAGPVVSLARRTRNRLHAGATLDGDEPQHHWLEQLPHTIDELERAWTRAEGNLQQALSSWAGENRQADNRVRALLRGIAEAAVFCRRDGTMLAYNDRFRHLAGKSPLLGAYRPLGEVIDTASLADLLAYDGPSDPLEGAATRFWATGLHAGVTMINTDAETGERLLILTPWGGDGPRTERDRLRASMADIRPLAEQLRTRVEGTPGSAGDASQLNQAITRLPATLDALLAEVDHQYAAPRRLPPVPVERLLNALLSRGIEPALPVTATRAWLHADLGSLVLAIIAIRNALGPLVAEPLGAAGGDRVEIRLVSTHDEPLSLGGDAIGRLAVEGLGEPATVAGVIRDHDGELRVGDAAHGGLSLWLPAARVTPSEPPTPLPQPRHPGRNRRLDSLDYVVFDTETTGLEPAFGDRIIAIGAQRLRGREQLIDEFETLVHPERPIPPASTRYHGITDAMVANAPPTGEAIRAFREFAGDAVLVAHNAAFDMRFLRLAERESGTRFNNPVLDTLLLSLIIDDQARQHTLEAIAERLGVTVSDRHSALGDARMTAAIFSRQLPLLMDAGLYTLGDAERACHNLVEFRRQQRAF